jgi:hypothetical protein
MSLLLPLEDAEFWCELLKTDQEFKECIREVAGLISIEIPKETLEASIDLSVQIETRVVDLNVKVEAIDAEFECLDIIIDFLEDQTNPEAIAFRNQMIARRAAKETIKTELETQIATLTPQIDLFATTTQTLTVSTCNASFLNEVLDAVDQGVDCEDLGINGS